MMYLNTKYVKASMVEYQDDEEIKISYFFLCKYLFIK